MKAIVYVNLVFTAIGIVYVSMKTEDFESSNESFFKEVSQLRTELANVRKTVENYESMIDGATLVGHFAGRVQCDSSLYTIGTYGHHAHQALKNTGICDAKLPKVNE